MLVDRVERLISGRALRRQSSVPSDEEAITSARRAVEALAQHGVHARGAPRAYRVVRGEPASRVATLRGLTPIQGKIGERMVDAAPEQVREALLFLKEPIYQLTAFTALTYWAEWPLIEAALGPCPLDPIVDLWERRAQAAVGEDAVVIWIDASA